MKFDFDTKRSGLRGEDLGGHEGSKSPFDIKKLLRRLRTS